MIAQVSITVQVAGGELKTYTYPNASFPYPPQFASSPATEQFYSLSSGANTISVPSGTSYAMIVPAAGSTVLCTILGALGVSGVTGVPLHNQNPSIIALASGVMSFQIFAASPTTVSVMCF